MKEEILSIASDLREGYMTTNEAKEHLLRLFGVIGSVCDGCGSKLDAMDISVGVCYCCQKEIKQNDL